MAVLVDSFYRGTRAEDGAAGGDLCVCLLGLFGAGWGWGVGVE